MPPYLPASNSTMPKLQPPQAAISAADIASPKKSFLRRLWDSFDDWYWDDEFYNGDPLAPAVVTARHAAWAAAYAHGGTVLPGSPGEIAEQVEQAALVREVFDNPFRPVTFDPAWRMPPVLNLARSMYDDRSFNHMPLLADSLTDAGCIDPQILGHCREPGPHVRGCWVVDLVLDKA